MKPSRITIKRPEIGETQGKLTVVDIGPAHRITCRCDCGAMVKMDRDRFVSQNARQCRACYDGDRQSKPKIDIAGQKFGMLTAIEPCRDPKGRVMWLCNCDCGGSRQAAAAQLRYGTVASCGCQRKFPKSFKHGMHKSPEYHAWKDAKGRCYNPKNRKYPIYGARGIRMCDRWLNDFEAFYADMGPRPSSAFSLDRIDGNGNYEAGNCRWATLKEQNNNTSFNHVVEFEGERLSVTKLCERFLIDRNKVYGRLKKGQPISQIVADLVSVRGGF